MEKSVDYINLIGIAKMNLNSCINEAREQYKEKKTREGKEKLIQLINDRKKLFLFDKETIQKYL